MVEPTTLQTERLILRPFRLEDVDDVYAYAQDEDWRRYLIAVPDEYTRQDAIDFVTSAMANSWNERPTFALQFDGRVVGGINLRVLAAQRIAEIGYGIARDCWGQGLVPEAARALIDWGFQTFDIAKIYATADARNIKSHRVMQKLGMTQEAQLRQHRWFRNEQVDEVLYALLREEWHKRRSAS